MYRLICLGLLFSLSSAQAQAVSPTAVSATVVSLSLVPAASSASMAVGISPNEIRLGMVNALSGPAMELGRELRQGAQVYLDKVNAEGGVHGKKLHLISYDDAYEPAQTIRGTRTILEQDGAFLLFGYVGTPTSRVVMPIANRAGVPYVAPFTGAAFLRSPVQPYVLNVRASYADETERLVHYLVDIKKITRIGMLIQNDGYGSSGREGVQKALARRGLALAAVGKYQRNTTDIAPALQQVKAADPQAVILVGAYAPCAAFIKEARRQGFDPLFLNISFVGTAALVKAMGPDGEGVYISQVMPAPETSDFPVVRQYREDMRQAGHAEFSYGSLEGYVNAVTLVRILRGMKELTRPAFIATAESFTAEDIGGLTLRYGPQDHQGLDQVYLTQVRGGKVVPVTEETPQAAPHTHEGK